MHDYEAAEGRCEQQRMTEQDRATALDEHRRAIGLCGNPDDDRYDQ